MNYLATESALWTDELKMNGAASSLCYFTPCEPVLDYLFSIFLHALMHKGNKVS